MDQLNTTLRADSTGVGEGPQTLATTSMPQMNMSISAINSQSSAQFEQAKALINDLLLSKVQSLRSTHIALSVTSLIVAALMLLRVWNDTRKAVSLSVKLRPKKLDFLRDIWANVHSAEVFPVILAFTIIIQQIIFIGVQGSALNSVLVTGCAAKSQVVFPAIFLPALTTFVFSVETIIRSLRARRFRPFNKWTPLICLAAVFALLLFVWIPTAVWRTGNRCLGDLVFFPVRFSRTAIGIISFLLFSYLVMASIISLQLMKSIRIEDNERVAASLVVYHIGISSFIYILVLPFWVQIFQRNFDTTDSSARVAAVALSLSGVITILGHHLLRTNATRVTIRAVGIPGETKRSRFRFFGPSDLQPLVISGPVMSPSSYPLYEKDDFTDMDFYDRGNVRQKARVDSNNPIDPSQWPAPPKTPGPEHMSFAQRLRNTTYSLFPTHVDEIPRLPATVYSPSGSEQRTTNLPRASNDSITDVGASFDGLQPPQPLFFSKHNRGASSNSRETVQIGLRFSVSPAAIGAANMTTENRAARPPVPSQRKPPPVLKRGATDSSDDSLGLPIQVPSTSVSSEEEDTQPTKTQEEPQQPKSPQAGSSKPVISPTVPIPSMLFSPKTTISFAATNPISPPPKAPAPPSPAVSASSYLEAARNKVLPPIPMTPKPSVKGKRKSDARRSSGANPLRLNPVVLKPLGSTTMNSNGTPSPTVRSPMLSSPPIVKSPAGWI